MAQFDVLDRGTFDESAARSSAARAGDDDGRIRQARWPAASGDALHIVALATDPMWQRSGVGGHLVAEAEFLARRLNLTRLVVATTNDNLPGLFFYQRRGYRLTDVVVNSVITHTGREMLGFGGYRCGTKCG